LTNITIENIDSKRLPGLKDFDCLIVDEMHHVAAKTYRDLNKKAWNGIYYRYFFTATPYRSRTEENILLESVAGQLIYEVSYKTSVDKGYIVPVEAYYIDLPSDKPDLVGSYASVYKKGVVQSQKHNELVATLIEKLHESKLSTLCIVKEIEHGDNLVNLSGAAFANGQSEDCRQLIDWFSTGKLKTLIATHGVAGEGVDTRACEYVLLPIPVKSKNLFMQIIGRGVRKYPGKESAKIILFRNTNHKWFKTAFKDQCKILKEEFGIAPAKLDI
jgi:superfamily II DNA or RNA helicase